VTRDKILLSSNPCGNSREPTCSNGCTGQKFAPRNRFAHANPPFRVFDAIQAPSPDVHCLEMLAAENPVTQKHRLNGTYNSNLTRRRDV